MFVSYIAVLENMLQYFRRFSLRQHGALGWVAYVVVAVHTCRNVGKNRF